MTNLQNKVKDFLFSPSDEFRCGYYDNFKEKLIEYFSDFHLRMIFDVPSNDLEKCKIELKEFISSTEMISFIANSCGQQVFNPCLPFLATMDEDSTISYEKMKNFINGVYLIIKKYSKIIKEDVQC